VGQQDAADLGPRAGQIDRGALAVHLAGEALDRRGCGRIENRHRREIDHISFRMLADTVQRRCNIGRRAEEERPGDPVHDDVAVGGERGIIGFAAVAVRDVGAVRLDDRLGVVDLDRLRHAMQEQERADPEAGEDACRQVAQDDEQEGRQQYHGIAARRESQGCEGVLLGHVPGDDDQHRRQRGCHEHEQQQEGRMQHARDRAAGAGPHIGGGPGDRAGDADAAEQGRCDIGHALGHQLAIGAVTPPAHAVRDHGRQQALDAAQQREGQRRRQDRCDFLERNRRQARRGQGWRDAAEAGADRLDRQVQQRRGDGGQADGDQEGRPMRPETADGDDGRDREGSDADRRQVRGRQRLAQRLELGDERPRLLAGERQAEKLLDLAGEDDDGDAGGEADRDRKRDVFDEGAEPQQPDREQDESRKHGGEQQALHPMLLDRRGDEHDERARRPADLEPAAAQSGDDEADDDRRIEFPGRA